MTPDYTAFWSAFRATAAWSGLMSMARYSEAVELRVLRLRVEMLDAINGSPNQADIQEAIHRLMELIASQSVPEQVGELVALMDTYGLSSLYTLQP